MRDVYQGNRQLDYLDDLKEAILDAWDRMPQTYINTLVESMPTRYAKGVTSRGVPIDY